MNRLRLFGATALTLTLTFLAANALELPKTDAEKKNLSGREVTLLRRQMKVREDEANAAYKNAETAFLVGEYDKAIEEYLLVTREYEDTSFRMRAVLRIGDVYYRQKKYERAVSYYQRALSVPSELWWPEESSEDYARASYMIGVCHFDQNALNQAFAHFRRFVQNYPNSQLVDRAYDFIGRGNMNMNRFGQAIDAFRMVGTARLDKEARRTIAPGEELYIRVTDADVGLAVKGNALKVDITTTSGDEETLSIMPLGLGSPIFLGTIKTRLGKPRLTRVLEACYPTETRNNLDSWLADAETMSEDARRVAAELAALPAPTEQAVSGAPATASDLAAAEAAKELAAKRTGLENRLKTLQTASTDLRKRAYSGLDTAYTQLDALLTEWQVETPAEKTPVSDVPADAAEGGSDGENQDGTSKPADRLSDVFTPLQITETRTKIGTQPTDADSFQFRQALLNYWFDQILQEYKTLDLSGADTIKVSYFDMHGVNQESAIREDSLGVASDASISCVGQDYSSIVKAVILGDEIRVRVIDLDMDRTEGPDIIEAVVATLPKVPEKKDDLTAEPEQDSSALNKEEEAQEQSVDLFAAEYTEQAMSALVPEGAPSVSFKLTETGDHTGVFIGSIPTVPEGESPFKALAFSPLHIVRVAYRDERSVSHVSEWVITHEVGIVLGAEGEHEVIELQESKLDRRSELEKGVALGKLGRVYLELGLAVESQRTFDEALKVVRKVVLAEGDSPLGEEATYQMWDLYFATGDEDSAAEACAKLIAAFPNSPLADDALLIMGKAEKRDRNRAAQHFGRLITQYPDSPLAPEAQFRLAELKSEGENLDVAAFEACANKFPESNFAALSLLKLAEYYVAQRDYARATEYLERITLDFPDFEGLDKATFMRGICAYRTGNVQFAYTLMHETIEKYPGTASAESAAKIVQLLAKKLTQK